MKKVGVICVGICMILSFFLIRNTSTIARASSETIITEDIEVSDSNKSLVLDVANGETVTLKGMKFVNALGFSDKATTVINVQDGGRLILEDVDFSLITFNTGIYNEGEIIVDGVTFANKTTSKSIVHNNSTAGSFKLLNGIISNIYLMSGNILVTEDSREIFGSDGAIKISLDENTVGKRVVVGENILPSYFVDSFEYVGSLGDAVLDYVGDNIADIIPRDETIVTLGLCPGDIVLTSLYSYIKFGGNNIYYANRYCTAREFLFNANEYIPSGLEISGYGSISLNVKNNVYTGGRYLNNFEAHMENSLLYTPKDDEVDVYRYVTDTNTVTIKYFDENENELTALAKSIDVVSEVDYAVFISIPKDYALNEVVYPNGITEVSCVESTPYIRPVINCTRNGTINVYLEKSVSEPEIPEVPTPVSKEILFDESYTFENNEITLEYAKVNYADLLQPYYMDAESKVDLTFTISKNNNSVDEITDVGEYTITFEDTADIDFVNNSYTVKVIAREITLEYSNLNFTYSGEENVVTVTLASGKINGDTINLNVTGNTRIDAGSNEIFVTIDNDNYLVASSSLGKAIVVDKCLININDLNFADASVEYDGQNHGLIAEVPNIIHVEYSTNLYSQVGNYEITASFSLIDVYDNNYVLPVESITKTLRIYAREITLEYSNLNFTYSGEENNVTVTLASGKIDGDTINLNVTGNTRIDAGSNEIIVTIDNDNYLVASSSLGKHIVVDKYTILSSEIVFESEVVSYDKQSHSIMAIVPNYLEVEYITSNLQSQVGSYEIIAKFSFADGVNQDNYSDLPFTTKSVTLTILAIDLPLGDISLEDARTEYDGSEKSLELTGEIPETSQALVSVRYEYFDEDGVKLTKNPIDAGVYTVKAIFTLLNTNNYNAIPDKTATLTIDQKEVSLSGIVFNGKEVAYDKNYHTISVENLPIEVEVAYSTAQSFKEVGNHTITANFDIKEEYAVNYKLKDEDKTRSVVLTITKGEYDLSGLNFEDKYYVYDGSVRSIEIDESKLPDGISGVTYINNSKSRRGNYTVIINFINADTDHYKDIDPIPVNLIIAPKPLTIEYVNTYVYTGSPISLKYTLIGKVGNDDVSASISNSVNTVATTYTCDVGLIGADKDNYSYDNSNKIRYEITKAVVDMSGVSIPKIIERTYDGGIFEPKLSGTLPSVVTAKYTHAIIKNVGEYSVSITFSVTDSNYIVPDKKETTVKINPKDISVEFTNWQNLIYDGKVKSLGVVFSGVYEDDFDDYYVEYTPSEVKNVGYYTCTVHLNEFSNYNLVAPFSREFMIMENKKVFTSEEINLEITGDTFAPDTDFNVVTGNLDAKTTNLLKSVNDNVKFSNQLKIDLDTDVALTVSLDAKFLDMANSENIKIYRLKGDVLELVEFDLKDDKISFETTGNEIFILVQENESSNTMLYLIISILGVVCVASSLIIFMLIKKKKNNV